MTSYNQVPAHGFVWPLGLPECSVCQRQPNDPVHVNPFWGGSAGLPMQSWSESAGATSPVSGPTGGDRPPAKPHPYQTNARAITANVQCVSCNQPLKTGAHVGGMTAGMMDSSQIAAVASVELPAHEFVAMDTVENCATCGLLAEASPHTVDGGVVEIFSESPVMAESVKASLEIRDRVTEAEITSAVTQQAFVTETPYGLLMAAPASTFGTPDALPRELAAKWETASAANPNNLWIAGRFVEADAPNRNSALWSTGDLEFGTPTVAHGPLNWLHDERHIIGTIADAEMVTREREAADDVGNHIAAMAAIWPYVWPAEARMVQQASEEGKLWYSMECRSRQVACQEPECGHVQDYMPYVLDKASRCPHVIAGAPRRFVDPYFLGGAVIVPPVSPGWAGANAKVMQRASELAEVQQAAFVGLDHADAELLVAQMLVAGDLGR